MFKYINYMLNGQTLLDELTDFNQIKHLSL